LMDTDNPIIVAASSASAAIGCLIILAYLIQRITRKKRSGKKET
jgi:energy-converting hydrogenase Eha subunit C